MKRFCQVRIGSIWVDAMCMGFMTGSSWEYIVAVPGLSIQRIPLEDIRFPVSMKPDS